MFDCLYWGCSYCVGCCSKGVCLPSCIAVLRPVTSCSRLFNCWDSLFISLDCCSNSLSTSLLEEFVELRPKGNIKLEEEEEEEEEEGYITLHCSFIPERLSIFECIVFTFFKTLLYVSDNCLIFSLSIFLYCCISAISLFVSLVALKYVDTFFVKSSKKEPPRIFLVFRLIRLYFFVVFFGIYYN